MKKLSLSIAVFLITFFSPHLFSANLLVDYDEHKEGSYSTQQNNQVEQPKQVCDYTILNNKNIDHTLEDIEDVEEDLRDYVSAVNQRLVTSNNQSTPLLIGAVLQHKQTKKYYQYLITSTGLLSETTQANAVKRAHKKGFHLIKATRGHVSLQLLEWLQISKHYIVIALHTNRPVCRNCYLIANSLWEKELKTNEKGCIESQFSVLDKMPNLAQQYINTHLNFPLVQNLVVPMMGYVSKEEMNKAIQQKEKQLKEKDVKHQQEIKEKDQKIEEHTNELNKKKERIETLNNQLNEKSQELKEKDEQIITLQAQAKQSSNELNKKNERIETLSNQLKDKDTKLDEKNEHINMLNKEVNKKDNQIKENQQKIAELQSMLQEIPKQPLNDNKKKELFKAIENNNLKKVKMFLLHYKDVVNAKHEDNYKMTPFLFAAENGQLAIAKLLKEWGANIKEEDKYGNNALHEACYSGSVEMVTWLVDVCKIDIESKGYKQMTPFISAAWEGKLEIAKLLKERGANIHAKDEDGKNALWWAKFYSKKEMRIYLKSLGLRSRDRPRKY